MRRLSLLSLALLTATLVLAAPAWAAAPAPSLVATPDTGLTDGATVSLTASGFIAATVSGGTVVPQALECANQFPASAVFDLQTALDVVSPLLDQYCAGLGTFPVSETGTTSRDVAVHRSFTTVDGTTVTCGATDGDCLVVATGAVPGAGALASAPISFAPPAPRTKADCRHGGWQHLRTDRGQHFRNQGRCIAWVVHRHHHRRSHG